MSGENSRKIVESLHTPLLRVERPRRLINQIDKIVEEVEMHHFRDLGAVFERKGPVGISRGESMPGWGVDVVFESIQFGKNSHGFPRVVRWIRVGW